MNAMQDQFTTIAKQGQDAVTSAVRTWAESVQRLSGQQGGAGPDVSAVVDNAFDLAERMLATQREFTKAVLRAVTASTGKVTDATAQTLDRVARRGAQVTAGTAGTAAHATVGAADSAEKRADAARSSAGSTGSAKNPRT